MEQQGLEISPQNASDALHAVTERHAWVATGLRVVGFASVVIATILFMARRDDLVNYLVSFFAVGFGTLVASRMRTYNAGAARKCLEAVEGGAVPRLHAGGIEVSVDGSLQRIKLSAAAAAKLTAQLVPPARARLT